MRLLALTMLFALSTAVSHAAQAPSDLPLPVPEEAGGWMARMVTSGGITGTGAGDIAIDSRGRISCRLPARCRNTVDAPTLAALGGTIARTRTPGFSAARSDSVCSDCYVTRLTLWRRNADGTLTTGVYVWTAIDAVPDDIRQIQAAIRSAATLPDALLRAQFRD